jgi:Tol biopolymer transport system component
MRKLAAILLMATSVFAQQTVLRFPAISPDGKEVLFSYQGDIWKAPAEGGTALRLTVNDAYESHPRWSPNGKEIAFSSKRYGNDDIFVMNANGANVRRVTYRSSGDILNDWSGDELFFTTRRDFRQVEWMYEIYSVSAKGGTPKRVLDAVGDMPALSPDGKYLAYVGGPCRISREAYRGPANRDIWIYDIAKKEYKRLTSFDGNDFMPRWGNDGTLYFTSSRGGKYNIFSIKINSNEKPKQITDFTDDGVFYFDVSANGEKIVMERAGKIYLLDLQTRKISEPQFDLSDDFRKPEKKFETAKN